MTRYFRFGEFEIVQNPDEAPTFGAVCVADLQECYEYSGNVGDTETMHKWIAEHTRDTGHQDFRRNYGGHCRTLPPDGAVIAGEVVGAVGRQCAARTTAPGALNGIAEGIAASPPGSSVG